MIFGNAVKMKINVLALALTALVGCGVGGVVWWDAQRTAAPSVSTTPTKGTPEARSRFGPPGTGGAPAVSREAAPPANGLYRCQGPKGVLYQAEPCPSGTKQAAVAGGTMNVISPPPTPTVRYSPPPAPRHEGKTVGLISSAPAELSGNEAACEHHERRIRKIDAEGRVGGSPQKMEWLRERRRYHTDEMWRLGCGR